MLIIGKSTDGPVSKYLNRKISTRITKIIIKYHIPLTPNQVSLISFILGVVATLSYVYVNPVVAGILVQLSSIIDGVDGELARALNKTSRKGGFIDAILDRIADIAIITGLTTYIVLNDILNPTLILHIAILAITGDLMVSYLHARGEASLGIHPLRIGTIPSIASRDVRLFIIFTGSIIGVIDKNIYWITLIIIAVISYVYVTLKTIEIYFKYQEEK